MKYSYLLVGLFLPVMLQAQAPSNYYVGTDGLEGFALKTRLHEILSGNTTSWNYGDLPGFYQLTDRDLYYEVDSSLLDIYSENPDDVDPYNYDYADTSQLISGASTEGLGWNREHLFSQSFFYGDYPMYSDMHFIVPTDARVNQRRSNLPFGEVNNSPTFTSLNGSKVGLNTTPGYTLTVFEPIDEFKGDVARALLYVAVRYESLLPFFQTGNTRNPFESRQEVALRSWLIPLLLQWHTADPVSERELNRNEHIFLLQGNRNPFVDHPSWAAQIWNADTGGNEVPDAPIYLSATGTGSRFVTLEWFNDAGNFPMGYEIYQNDTLLGISRETTYVATGLTPGVSYEFKVRAYDRAYNWSPMSTTLQVATQAADTFATALFFSKYIEGTGNNKALEIKNLTGHTVDLRQYNIGIRQYNEDADALYWSDNQYQMEGKLAHGAVAVLIHPESNLSCFEVDSATFVTAASSLSFTGWLAIDLRKEGTTVDRIGNPNEYASFATDVSLYRNEDILQPNPGYDSGEWTIHSVDYCEGLGLFEDPNGIESPQIDTVAWTVYPNPTTVRSLHVQGKSLEESDRASLLSVQGQVLAQWDQPFKRSNQLVLPGALPAGLYFLNIDGKVTKIVLQ